MLLYKQKKSQTAKGNRLLVNISVFGSAGPIRFVVFEEDLVSSVIDTALKSYAREGRFPILESDTQFLLYCPKAGSHALSPWSTIGSVGARDFTLYKKPPALSITEDALSITEDVKATERLSRKGSGGNWKSWFNKSLNRRISSH